MILIRGLKLMVSRFARTQYFREHPDCRVFNCYVYIIDEQQK